MAEDRPHQPESRGERGEHVYGKPPGAGDWKRISRLVALGVLIVYTLLFFLLNRNTVEVNLVVTTASIPLVWILIGTFLLGVLAAYLLSYLRRRAARKVVDG
jgi:uncharacterized integral membrane protein